MRGLHEDDLGDGETCVVLFLTQWHEEHVCCLFGCLVGFDLIAFVLFLVVMMIFLSGGIPFSVYF